MFFSSKKAEWLFVFLGNPGKEYRDTRHNAGFWAGQALAKHWGVSIKRLKFSSLTARYTFRGIPVFLQMPQTYMNLSGGAVYGAAKSLRIPPEQILVVTDDIMLEPGRLRFRAQGSAGGHNGLKSIISALGTDEFPRLKIGVGAPPSAEVQADWVTGIPRGKDKAAIHEAMEQCPAAFETVLLNGLDAAMNQFNRV